MNNKEQERVWRYQAGAW